MFRQNSPLEQRPTADLGWRIFLCVLLLVQLLAMISSAGPIFIPLMTQWASALYRIFGIASFFGLLLWCSESVQCRPELTRFALRLILGICLFWCASPLLLPAFRKNDFGARRREDVAKIFQELVAEGVLSAPHPAGAFIIRSRHGTTFSISYTNAAGDPRRYFVSEGFERFWKFQNMTDRSEIQRPATYLEVE